MKHDKQIVFLSITISMTIPGIMYEGPTLLHTRFNKFITMPVLNEAQRHERGCYNGGVAPRILNLCSSGHCHASTAFLTPSRHLQPCPGWGSYL